MRYTSSWWSNALDSNLSTNNQYVTTPKITNAIILINWALINWLLEFISNKFVKLHLNLVKISLYDKKNIDFQVNHNINPNYYLELIRSVRKLMGYSIAKQEYYKFKGVDRTMKTGKKTLKKKSKKLK